MIASAWQLGQTGSRSLIELTACTAPVADYHVKPCNRLQLMDRISIQYRVSIVLFPKFIISSHFSDNNSSMIIFSVSISESATNFKKG